MSNVNVRLAVGADAGLLARYLRALSAEMKTVELAEGESSDWLEPPQDLEARLLQHGPGGDCSYQAIVVELDGMAHGMAMFSLAYDGLLAASCVSLRHIYVEPEMRRRRLGTCMMVALARLCLNQGWRRVDWQVRRLDMDARVFFDKLSNDSFKLHRLCYGVDQAALAALAELSV